MEEKKIKIEIKNRWTGKILFEYEKVSNTIKETVIEALKRDADLRGAYLRGADLSGAYLRGANLSDAYLRGADLRGADLSGAYLRGANLSDADLRGANLSGANLSDADLRGADLSGANLSGANLSDADPRGADLSGAYLRGANLSDADLRGAYLRGANLRDADLRGADLSGAYLRDADLSDAKDVPFIPMACPSDGAFIGWKKVYYQATYYLVKLEIPEDAKRSSSTGRKCRCDRAKVLEIIDLENEGQRVDEVISSTYTTTSYRVGEMVYPDSYDDDRWKECSHGIHFFINRQEAVDYDL